MRGAFLLLVCAMLPWAQEPRSAEESPAERREKRIAAILEEVDGLAGAETPQLAIDSLIRCAKSVRSRDKAKAMEFLQSAKERLPAFHSEHAKATFSSLLGQYWSELDPEGSEEICRSIPRTPPEVFESDPRSACWATRITRETKPGARAEVSLRAFADGAYSTTQHAATMTQLQKADPEGAAAFLAAYLASFPEKTAGLPELKGLVHLLRAVGADQPTLSRQALELAVRAIERKDFPEPKRAIRFEARVDGRTIKTSGARDSLAFQLADLAWMIAPDLLESHAETLGKWKTDVTGGDWQRRRVTRFREVEPGLDAELRQFLGVDGAEIDLSALDSGDEEKMKALLGAASRPETRLLIQAHMLTDGNVPPQERPNLVKDIRITLEKVPTRSRLRLLTLFFLVDEALEREAVQQASDLGRQLVAAFDATLACPAEECETAAAEMQPGELAKDFLEYLKKKELDPPALGIVHPTLTLRQRLLELDRLLEEASPKRKSKATQP